MSKLLGEYINGNYNVLIYEDGTKIRQNELDNLTPDFAESIDVKLTDRCSVGCSFCYENCKKDGKHSDIMNQAWIESVHPYTELAINGNDLDHPDLYEFLDYMRSKNVIVNMTVNQKQFIDHKNKIDGLIRTKKIFGLGVSINSDINREVLRELVRYPNLVVHVINGLITENIILKYKEEFCKLKILVLGYKSLGRGLIYEADETNKVEQNKEWLKSNIIDLIRRRIFKICSFDNLAIEQLELEKQVRERTGFNWDELYLGNDGDYSFYIDAVNGTYAKSSITKNNNSPIENKTVDEMFKDVRDGREIL